MLVINKQAYIYELNQNVYNHIGTLYVYQLFTKSDLTFGISLDPCVVIYKGRGRPRFLPPGKIGGV